MKQYDVCVIGSGPGGYVAAIRASQFGKKVLVVEREYVGGVCLNVGCIPSKGMITASHFFEEIKNADEMGIQVGDVKIDLGKLQQWKQSVVTKLTSGVAGLFKMNKIDLIMGEAKFVNSKEVEVRTKEGTEKIVATDYIVANGSRPIEIPGFKFDGKNVLSSTEGLALQELPKRLVVIGGGYIGLEIGSYWRKLGSEVTVVEATPALLNGVADPDCVQVVARKLKKSGVNVILNAKATGFKQGGKELSVSVQVDGKEQTLSADKILVTVGRRPNSDQMNLAGVGLQIDQKGFIKIDHQCRTNIPHIFAIGDVAGQPMLAHKASREGIVVAEVIGGLKSAMDVKTVPAVVFTDPEIASAGMMESEAKAKGYDIYSAQFPFAANGRALTMMAGDGFVKLVADKKTNLLLGVHIVGPEASNLISEAVLAIEMGATVEDIALTIHPHPTLGEAMMEAAETTLGHPIHIFVRKESERGTRASAAKT